MSRRVGIEPKLATEQAQKTQISEQAFHPLPAPTGPAPYRITSEALGIPAATGGVRYLHLTGDTGGIINDVPQMAVVKAMIADLVAQPEVAFFLHTGDIGYYNGELQAYIVQLAEAYCEYRRLICGAAGNHDGDSEESLVQFMKFFCDTSPRLLPEVEEYHRDTVTQPNVFWTLEDDLCTVINLYSNVPSGGVIKEDQAEWYAGELAAAAKGKALITNVHHPAYSVDDHHGGSAHIGEVIDKAIEKAGRCPDLVTHGHVHDLQHFRRTFWGRTIDYYVAGNGGYRNRHPLAADATPGLEVASGVKFLYGDASEWGFTRLAVSATSIDGEYVGVAGDGTVTPAKYTFSTPVLAS